MYVYESHLGGLYIGFEEYDYDDLYCEQCGDSDNFVGRFDSVVDYLKAYADDIDCEDGNGGYDINHVLDVLNQDGKISKTEAIEIVKTSRKNKRWWFYQRFRFLHYESVR